MTLDNLRIFISYPRGGAAHTWAEEAHAYLENRGARVFRDEIAVKEGESDWCRGIEDGLLSADLVLAVIGTDSAVCRWQERELLYADSLNLHMLVLRVAPVSLPFAITEKQPVEARPDRVATWDALHEAIRHLELAARRAPTQSVAGVVQAGQRRAELLWLDSLIFRDYSDREARYVALEGVQRESLSSSRAMNGLRMETHAVLKAFRVEQQPEAAVREQTYPDVLDAYRKLRSRPVRRLAVLGEPGAGKSFSLERIAVDYAGLALQDESEPIPLLVPLGLWTRDGEDLESFIARSLGGLGRYLPELIRQGRAVLLLDAINEIPPGQRRIKARRIKTLVADERLASVIVSCREKDFAEFDLPFDTLTLQPLSPPQVREFLHRFFARKHESGGNELAEACFWRIAGGEKVREAWEEWHRDGEIGQFWTFGETESVSNLERLKRLTSGRWRSQFFPPRFHNRSLLLLAANPYLLHIMAELGADLPANRARLFEGFLRVLHEREIQAREARHEQRGPDLESWLKALSGVAEALQRLGGIDDDGDDDDGARTTLPKTEWPAELTAELLDFSRDANVLELRGDDLRFSHQLLQEYLASRLLLEASRTGRDAADFWPRASWWKRTGWEVVAEIAAESCLEDTAAFQCLMDWLGQSNPNLLIDIWGSVGSPSLSAELLGHLQDRWLNPMTDLAREPVPIARATIGRALARLGLDKRPGVGIRADSFPDIDWVEIPGPEPFIYQGQPHPGLPTFWLARYPVTNAQFEAFVDSGGYEDNRWWQGLIPQKLAFKGNWNDNNCPRVQVSWYEAIAFCRWLSAIVGESITLPTEEQWERAACGRDGSEYPWEDGYQAGFANWRDDMDDSIGRTSAVGIFPQSDSREGLFDLAGNVNEWCLDWFKDNRYPLPSKEDCRVLRGGAFDDSPNACRSSRRHFQWAVNRRENIGFRLCRNSLIQSGGTTNN